MRFIDPIKIPFLDKWITKARRKVGIIPFSRKEGIIKARSHLKKGKNWLAVLFDQNAGEYGTIYPFLDRVCSMSILPNILVRKSGRDSSGLYCRKNFFFPI